MYFMLYFGCKKGKGIYMNDISNLTFKQFIDNCKVLKAQYEELFTPFLMQKSIRCWKIMIYSLDIAEWKRDKLWEYLNSNLEYEELIKLKDH